MIALYIDTTSEYSLVQISNDSKTFVEERWLSEHKLGDDLLPKIVKMLDQASITLKDLNCIVVNGGPGSFTGTRVGVSTANALAWSLNIPVFASDHINAFLKTSVGQNPHFTKPVVPKYATPPKVTIRKH